MDAGWAKAGDNELLKSIVDDSEAPEDGRWDFEGSRRRDFHLPLSLAGVFHRDGERGAAE